MATILDDQVSSILTGSLAADLAEGRRADQDYRRSNQQIRMDAAANLAESTRLQHQGWMAMLNNSIATSRFGDGLADDILEQNSALGEPGRAAPNDPNWRSAAVAPGRAATFTSPTGGSVTVTG